MSNHTPGPWTVDWESSDLFSQFHARAWINAEGLHHIGYVDGPSSEERRANARLIAAAPELLEALQLLVAGIENGVSKTFVPLQHARAAIAKAEGA